MNQLLEHLKNKRLVWQGHCVSPEKQMDSSGYSALDGLLHGGFPQQGVVDIHSQLGIGEFRLLQSLLATRHNQQQNHLVLIAPPLNINAEMLASAGIALSRVLIIQTKTVQESLWAAEQCLKSGCCHSVISWLKQVEVHQVKRLQLAAKQSQALHILFRPVTTLSMSLPVTLAMGLQPTEQGLQVTINKQMGGWPKQPHEINMRSQWPMLTLPTRNNVLPFAQKQAG